MNNVNYTVWILLCLIYTGTLLFTAPAAIARELNLNISSKLPTQANLIKMREKIEEEPDNLDHYFAFANMAKALKQHESAARAYEDMLVRNPELERIKLDLGVTYIQLGRLEDAKTLMEQVLERDPPEAVRANIETILAQLDETMQQHDWHISVAAGLNLDSNATSSSASGRITVLDTDIPLSADQQSDQDLQYFATATLSHRYEAREPLLEGIRSAWDNSASYYQAEQETEDDLDIKVLTLKTGPTLYFDESQISSGLKAGYSHIILDNHSYLRLYSVETDTKVPLAERIIGSVSAKWEARDFINSPDVSTYDDRQGHAYESKAAVKFFLDDAHILDVEAMLRREETRVEYYDNKQWGLNASLTKILPYDAFAQFRLGYKQTNYDGADNLISAKRRHDNEKRLGITIGKNLGEGITLITGYELRDVNSNIQNYTYDNHRFSTTLSWQY